GLLDLVQRALILTDPLILVGECNDVHPEDSAHGEELLREILGLVDDDDMSLALSVSQRSGHQLGPVEGTAPVPTERVACGPVPGVYPSVKGSDRQRRTELCAIGLQMLSEQLRIGDQRHGAAGDVQRGGMADREQALARPGRAAHEVMTGRGEPVQHGALLGGEVEVADGHHTPTWCSASSRADWTTDSKNPGTPDPPTTITRSSRTLPTSQLVSGTRAQAWHAARFRLP